MLIHSLSRAGGKGWGGGGTWVCFGWVCAARDSKLAPRSKKNSPKIDTPFQKWANFLYPVLEFALKLIPRSRNGPLFYTPFQKVCKLNNSPVLLKRYFFIFSTYTSNKCFLSTFPVHVDSIQIQPGLKAKLPLINS